MAIFQNQEAGWRHVEWHDPLDTRHCRCRWRRCVLVARGGVRRRRGRSDVFAKVPPFHGPPSQQISGSPTDRHSRRSHPPPWRRRRLLQSPHRHVRMNCVPSCPPRPAPSCPCLSCMSRYMAAPICAYRPSLRDLVGRFEAIRHQS